MIIVRAVGGLGNQMFQYAFYKSLCENNNHVMFDKSDYRIHNHHNGFEIESIFNVHYVEASEGQIKKISFDKKSVLYRIANKYFNVQLTKKSEYKEDKCISNVKLKKYDKDIYFDGYWQAEKYFIDVSDQIRKEFVFKNKLDDRNRKLIKYLHDKNTVSIHVRRGDYLKEKSLVGVCDMSYYNKAIGMVKDKVSNPVFVFFSDDMLWVKENFKLDDECIFVDWNTGSNSYKDMQLMSNCKHNIIANSTFSWWGAWLNNNDDKIVICPSKWSNDSEDNNLISEKWKSI
ncbi:alpha-1,2-fucosyltransferase [Clostridium sp. HBUAS56017]|uniref:alpha-1,2-fucosyltransferase n=1 Tax=Clostridium sp. HBUAS56017 TaxID=2571128 RepID=UPI0011781693|nr:alpha-1,2-fucosyltransferase [Clostridium sp. HBUAS56017]